MLSEVQPQASALSAVQEVASVYAAQGSAGIASQPHGAQAAPVGQAGQPQTATGADPVLAALPVLLVWSTVPEAPPVLAGASVVVVVAPLLHEQLQVAHGAPAGHSGQLQVQVPDPPVPLPPPVPLTPVPLTPPVPLPPPVPVAAPQPAGRPQLHPQAGQDSPGGQAGQSQVQMPPPLPPPPVGGGQSH